MLKEGTQHLTGLDEAVLRNIEAAKKLTQLCRTSLGPNGNDNNIVRYTRHEQDGDQPLG